MGNITVSELQRRFDYRDDGVLVRKVRASNQPAGTVAGSIANTGYVMISIDRRDYLAHRLVWLHFRGEWPDGDLDHINGIKHDNRIENLRLATKMQNMANIGRFSSNTSGAKGVHWLASKRKWQARIRIDGRRVHLGYFDTLTAAAKAYDEAALKHRGEFARI
jgi:hypothetical protein